jgi:hypothetical protein
MKRIHVSIRHSLSEPARYSPLFQIACCEEDRAFIINALDQPRARRVPTRLRAQIAPAVRKALICSGE